MFLEFPKPEDQFERYTSIPNVLFDVVQKLIDPQSFSILMYMCRKTYGFHKNSDQIPMAQIEADTGMCHTTVSKRIKLLLDVDFIKITREADRHNKQARHYSINYGIKMNIDV